jgi:nicotinamide phosphoribosyltransferase
MGNKTILPQRHIFQTPLPLQTDAYTVGSPLFQSPEAVAKSSYYITFRRTPFQFNPDLYEKADERIIFEGLNRILERLFYKPMTHADIDETKLFLATFKVTLNGLRPYPFPEALLRRVVDEFGGRPPIRIKALPAGSIVYPNEPVVLIESAVEGFGELAAWFEAPLLQVYAMSEAATQGQHWLKYLRAKISSVDPTLDAATVDFKARLMLTDMGARAGFNQMETEDLGLAHLYAFPGTDTLSGAYQAFKNAGDQPVGNSVLALAHRNVQAYEKEQDCYQAMFDKGEPGELLSMVGDAYGFKNAVENMQTPLAVRSAQENLGIIIVSRPDSGDPFEQVMLVVNSAIKAGLYTEQVREGKTWLYPTTQHFIEADGMNYASMKELIEQLCFAGIAFYDWGLFGMGGGLRNNLKRDNLSAKYALSAYGLNDRPAVKFSETLGKTTLPGPFKLCRDPYALEMKQTIQQLDQAGTDAMVVYYDGSNVEKPFGPGQDDHFPVIKARMDQQMATMPMNLRTAENHGYPATEAILTLRRKLLAEYAPDKSVTNY